MLIVSLFVFPSEFWLLDSKFFSHDHDAEIKTIGNTHGYCCRHKNSYLPAAILSARKGGSPARRIFFWAVRKS